MGNKKEKFTSIDDEVRMYTCGPTVYNYAHIGNLKSYIFEDILRRVLEYNNFSLKHVMNITDVGHLTDDADQGEDKVEKEAKK
ncbi:MAG: cysteine--tRNA ligase, partial [Candidatus Woesearchaeota archaeon]